MIHLMPGALQHKVVQAPHDHYDIDQHAQCLLTGAMVVLVAYGVQYTHTITLWDHGPVQA